LYNGKGQASSSAGKDHVVPTGPQVILALKIAVTAVTLLLLTSLAALVRGNYRLHGRINLLFFGLTLIALLGLEVIVRVLNPDLFYYFDEPTRQLLIIHLCFSLPATGVMGIMLWTGLKHYREWHLYLAGVFTVLWLGTFVTGVFFLPHDNLSRKGAQPDARVQRGR
jgi:uncharacterized membrane protein YozB (DUF420 family)